MKFAADLHTHTTYSDGMLAPAALVQYAQQIGLRALAVTDHDTVGGVGEAVEEGKIYGIDIIPGIELSASINGKEIHILGYFIDTKCKQLVEVLSLFKKERLKRAEQIVGKLNKLNIHITIDDVLAFVGEGVVARPHIARAMLEQGFVESCEQVYADYIGDFGPAYVKKFDFPVQHAIEMVRNTGGLSVLAHPGHSVTEDELDTLIKEGIDGIEVVHPSHSTEEVRYYRGITNEYYLIETGGSDYHGGVNDNDGWFGKVTVPIFTVATMRSRLSQQTIGFQKQKGN